MDYLWLSDYLKVNWSACWIHSVFSSQIRSDHLEIPRLDPDDPNIKGKNWEAVEKAGFRWPTLERNTMAFFGVFNFEPWHFCHENLSFFHQPVWNDGCDPFPLAYPFSEQRHIIWKRKVLELHLSFHGDWTKQYGDFYGSFSHQRWGWRHSTDALNSRY